jgi:hypothetical protein
MKHGGRLAVVIAGCPLAISCYGYQKEMLILQSPGSAVFADYVHARLTFIATMVAIEVIAVFLGGALWIASWIVDGFVQSNGA